MTKETLLEVEISKVVNGGYGLARLNGLVYLIPFGYPGDIALVNPYIKQKNLVWGQIKKLQQPSPHRVEKLCPQMGNCGACMWGMLNYEKQIEYKKQLLEENIKKFLKNIEVNINIIYDEHNKYHYRTRVIYHGDGKNLGFYKFHTKQIIDVSKCVITHSLIESIRKEIYPKNTNKDICITINPNTNEYLIYPTYIDNNIFKKSKCEYKEVNNRLKDYFLFDHVPIVNGSFSQNSLILNKILRKKVQEIIQNDEKILDLYCGSGNFTIDLPKEKYVVGIDIDPIAIQKANEFSNFQYKVGDEIIMSEFLYKENWDTILLDPPRAGAKKLIPYLKKAKTKKIIYISCEPVAMCRDTKELIEKGWKIQNIIGVDMFPHTPHIESITILSK